MKKSLTVLMACALSGAVLAGCLAAPADYEEKTEVTVEKIEEATGTAGADDGAANSEKSDGADADDAAGSSAGVLRVGALKGPTSMGLVSLDVYKRQAETAKKLQQSTVSSDDFL